jgi:hypothetical protein
VDPRVVTVLRLREAGRDAEGVWGEALSDEEAAARLLSIHLDESLATQEPHESAAARSPSRMAGHGPADSVP